MASEPGHPFWLHLVKRVFDQPGIEEATKAQVESLTGPGILTVGHREFPFDEEPYLPPRRHFHSPGLRGADDTELPDHVYGYHLVEGTWRPPAHRAKSMARKILRSRR